MKEELNITQEWDKVFPQSSQVNHRKVTFPNRFGITLVADCMNPKSKQVSFRRLQLVGHLVQSKNNHQVFMLKRWLNEDF